jgi:hypothetical protein
VSRGLGRYILALPLRKVTEVEAEVLTRPGRYKLVAENLLVKEGCGRRGKRRRRNLLSLDPAEAERWRQHRD